MNSCLYVGAVEHHRKGPTQHSFRFPLFMMYLDLDEIPEAFDGRLFWSVSNESGCKTPSHFGAIAVWSNSDSQYSSVDIDATNWLNGTTRSKTAISFFVR